ncbi:MAG: glycosyltransferase family 9 protein, partial [Nanopusillaceae archaeon]
MKLFRSKKSLNAIVKTTWGNKLLKLEKGITYVATTSFYNILNYSFNRNTNSTNFIDDVEILEPLPETYLDIKPLNITRRFNNKTYHTLDELVGKVESPRILILNGFISGIGDNLVGMAALKVFDKIYRPKFKSISYDIYNENYMRIKDTLQRYNYISNYLDFPQDATNLNSYDAILDLDDIHAWYEFQTMPMVDCFLYVMGIDPSQVDPEDKRIVFDTNDNAKREIKLIFDGIRFKSKKPIILFQYESSSKIRGIFNKEILIDIINKLIKRSGYNIVILNDLDYDHFRLLKMKKFSPNLDYFAEIINNVDGVICTDTSAYHLADSYSKPTIALFTSINPNLRVKYYPTVEPIYLPGSDNNRLFGKFDSLDKEDLAYVDSLWKSLDIDEI